MRERWVRTGEAWWLPVILLAIAAQPSMSYLLMGVVDGSWFPAGFWLASGLILVAFLLWLPVGWDVRWGVWPILFLAGLVAAWAAAMVSSLVNDNVFLGAVVWLPVAVAMLLAKRPRLTAVIRAADVFGWVLVIGLMVFLVLDVTGVIAHRVPVVSAEYELSTYWLPLSEGLGLPGRWAGPFAHPNLTSPVAVFLVVYGCWRVGPTRAAFVSAGAVVLLLTGTRSALGGLAVGLLLVVALRLGWLDTGRKVAVWGVAILGVGLLAGAGVLASGETLEGRVPMWSQWLGLAQRDPAFGIGDPGVTLAIAAGELPSWAVHGHNLLFDPIVRYGVVAQASVIVVLVAAIVVTASAASRGRGIGLATLAASLVCGVFESTVDWRYLNVQLTLILISVLLAAARPSGGELGARHTPRAVSAP